MPDDPENALSLVPGHLAPWANIINRGWPIEAGPMPNAAEAQQALELGAKAGTKVGLAWTMYCRPEGATHKEVTAVCGGPQRNAATEAAQKRKVAFEPRNRADGTLAHFLGPPGGNLGEPGTKPVAKLLEEIMLDPAAVTRWIERLRLFFPGLDRFDKPDPDFDAGERDYKLEVATELRSALEKAATEEESADAIHSALVKSNLLPWRAYWPMSPKGDADRERLWPALSDLGRAALGAPEGYAAALETFVAAWMEAVPKASTDAARQIAEFLFLHVAPDEGIYIRHTVRQDLWLEAVGRKFPAHASMAQTYAEEQRFMREVRQAFEERGLAPRDMIDVQSALWVVHNYKDNEDGSATSQSLTRKAVEAAMDAYDEYRKPGDHGEVFDSFGGPRDYWVRSTRSRANRVYPTKPLVGFILKKTKINGGWGQKADAAARLHNAGFIIVDQDDKPVTPPERYDHLVGGADRIRLCALNYFIAPARERGASAVSIRAGDLAAAMGLKDAFPNICQALGGEKLQQLARVPAPTHTEPNPSSSTIFTYKLESQTEADTVTEATSTPAPLATNLILYGPPGTGKTYRTAWEAVRLCLGEQMAAALQGDENRNTLMAEYRELVGEGRIEFVTFHQTMSYEEFVEGLRPSTGDDGGDGPEEVKIGAGFRLKPHDGVFKRVSERARLVRFTPAGTATDDPIDLTQRVFKMSLGDTAKAEGDLIFDECIREGKILMGFNLGIDWSDDIYEDIDEILRRSRQVPGHEDISRDSGFVSFQDTLRNGIEVGSIVLVSRGLKKLRAIGVVTGEYFFDAQRDDNYKHGRPVEWIWSSAQPDTDIDVSRFYPNDFSRPTLYMLRKPIDWSVLLPLIRPERRDATDTDRQPLNYVLIIDEINRANISRVFGELITLLEPDKRLGMANEIRLMLPYSKKPFGVPANLHIIGTMNTADRSIALLDTALRRRFTFQELMPDPSVLPADVNGINLQKLLTTINDRIEYLFDREHQIGHAYFTGCETRDCVDGVMRHKVIPLLAEYFYEDWSKVAAVLGDTGQGLARFLEARRLAAPAGAAEADFAGEKLRWRVKDQFDFSEFEA